MIGVNDLVRAYSKHKRPAVDGITFSVSRGEVLGFLGPNGAGKSTTMKVLTCFLPPTNGHVTIAGHNVYSDSIAVRKHVGYLPEDTPLYKDMTVLGYLEYVAELRNIPFSERKHRIGAVGETTGILDVLGKYIRELSRGYRQRVGLAQAMIHDPDVLILDEPTSGLDPNQIVEIRELVRRIGKEKTVILSTHILPEVQATCTRVVIINHGKIVADGTPDALIAQEQTNRYRMLFARNISDNSLPPATAIEQKIKALSGVKHITHSDTETNEIQFDIVSDATTDLRLNLFQLASQQNLPLLELDRKTASLEDVFSRLTRSEEL